MSGVRLQGAAAQFDAVADAYATSAVHARGADLQRMVNVLAAERSWEVLDLGTGAGHAAMAVARHVRQIIAVDVSPRMLSVTERLCAEQGIGNVQGVEADGRALPFSAERFAGAISRFSAHHWPDPDQVMREVRRVLRPGAPFVLVDSMCPTSKPLDTFLNALELLRDPSHGRNEPIGSWRDRLSGLGFRVEHEEEWLLELEVDEWLQRSATVSWRAEACRCLLAEAPVEAKDAFAVAADGSRFSLPCALIRAVYR
jgi:ubiquinone/menaquinone biosynthesis C-methylase UbiE